MKKVVIANRGEIAVRIARTLREMGISVVALYSDADKDALHVRMADEAYAIGPAPAAQSYLNVDKILEVAQRCGADGLAPGYGFLSENADFARACAKAGICFIGPSPDAISQMGSKTGARALMQAAGVPIVPGGPADDISSAKRSAAFVGYPVLVKASAGGGGKGMRLVNNEAELEAALERAKSEAERSFGDATVYIEKAILEPRHVEVQVLGDQHGNVVHLFERDCSIQRRHQKVIEETPAPGLSPALVAKMGEISVKGARAIGYFSAGTFEFIIGRGTDEFYFLEMNTRLQVEHPITELVTGLDLVREMVRVARGERLGYTQEDIVRRGAAIECRIYAEDPARGFLPSPGLVESLELPGGPGVRDDSGIVAGYKVTPYYDPLLSKLSVWAPDRSLAIARMSRALTEYRLKGLRHNLEFHRRVMQNPDFIAGTYSTAFIQKFQAELTEPRALDPETSAEVAQAIALAQAHLNDEAGRNAQTTASRESSNWGKAGRNLP